MVTPASITSILNSQTQKVKELKESSYQGAGGTIKFLFHKLVVAYPVFGCFANKGAVERLKNAQAMDTLPKKIQETAAKVAKVAYVGFDKSFTEKDVLEFKERDPRTHHNPSEAGRTQAIEKQMQILADYSAQLAKAYGQTQSSEVMTAYKEALTDLMKAKIQSHKPEGIEITTLIEDAITGQNYLAISMLRSSVKSFIGEKDVVKVAQGYSKLLKDLETSFRGVFQNKDLIELHTAKELAKVFKDSNLADKLSEYTDDAIDQKVGADKATRKNELQTHLTRANALRGVDGGNGEIDEAWMTLMIKKAKYIQLANQIIQGTDGILSQGDIDHINYLLGLNTAEEGVTPSDKTSHRANDLRNAEPFINRLRQHIDTHLNISVALRSTDLAQIVARELQALQTSQTEIDQAAHSFSSKVTELKTLIGSDKTGALESAATNHIEAYDVTPDSKVGSLVTAMNTQTQALIDKLNKEKQDLEAFKVFCQNANATLFRTDVSQSELDQERANRIKKIVEDFRFGRQRVEIPQSLVRGRANSL